MTVILNLFLRRNERMWPPVYVVLFPHMAFKYLECLIFSFCVWDGKNFRYVEKQASEKQVALLTDERFLKVGMWVYLFQFYSFFPS